LIFDIPQRSQNTFYNNVGRLGFWFRSLIKKKNLG
jgi:hypothetical protein